MTPNYCWISLKFWATWRVNVMKIKYKKYFSKVRIFENLTLFDIHWLPLSHKFWRKANFFFEACVLYTNKLLSILRNSKYRHLRNVKLWKIQIALKSCSKIFLSIVYRLTVSWQKFLQNRERTIFALYASRKVQSSQSIGGLVKRSDFVIKILSYNHFKHIN